MNVESIIAHAEQQCKDRGARLTPKRKLILSALISSKKALSAYELMDVCETQFSEKIPAMSVYRILEFLEGQELLHKLKLANKYVACAHIRCDHAHGIPQFLICGECSEVKEIHINSKTIKNLQASVDEAGYTLVSPQLEMSCLCNSCA